TACPSGRGNRGSCPAAVVPPLRRSPSRARKTSGQQGETSPLASGQALDRGERSLRLGRDLQGFDPDLECSAGRGEHRRAVASPLLIRGERRAVRGFALLAEPVLKEVAGPLRSGEACQRRLQFALDFQARCLEAQLCGSLFGGSLTRLGFADAPLQRHL